MKNLSLILCPNESKFSSLSDGSRVPEEVHHPSEVCQRRRRINRVMPRVYAVDEANLPAVQAFLEQHVDHAMFLLSNLAANGPRIGTALSSGNFKVIEENGRVRAVFCLTRRTNILAESSARTEFARTIVDACRAESIPIGGVIGEWNLAEAIWSVLRANPGFKEVYTSKEVLQARNLNEVDPLTQRSHVRHLHVDDFEQWDRVNAAFCAEEGIPVRETPAARKALFEQIVQACRMWGYFEDGLLLAMAGLNAVYKHIGQVAGVYTVPDRRRSGLSKATMNALLADSASLHGLQRMILFTGEHNHAARHLYRLLAFRRSDILPCLCVNR